MVLFYSTTPFLGIKYKMQYEFSDMTFKKFTTAIGYLSKMENEHFRPTCLLYNDNLKHVDLLDLSRLCFLATKKLKIQ